ARGVKVSVSVTLLSDRSGSVTPAGGVTLAVFVRLPVAAGSMAPVTVYVTVPPTGMNVTVSLILPLPDRAFPTTPAGPTLVSVPVAAGSMVPDRVMLTDCPVARLSPLQTPVAGL